MRRNKVFGFTLTIVIAILALVFIGVSSSHAELIGLSSDSSGGRLYRIDTATGSATLITTTNLYTSFVGIEFMNGTLYATDVLYNGAWSFGSINMSTGAFTFINDQGGSANWHGLAANAAAGLLYTVDLNNSNILKSVTPSGVITSIGSGNTDVDGRGMAYDSVHGILYATGGGNLYTLDTTTGTATQVGAMDISTGFCGLAYDPVTNILYANSGNGNELSLYTINTTTSGLATLIGPNGVSVPIDGLAYQAVPLPPSLFLLAPGLFGLAAVRRRFKK
jgi:hypothetical protein